jgi:hypothetical protein
VLLQKQLGGFIYATNMVYDYLPVGLNALTTPLLVLLVAVMFEK